MEAADIILAQPAKLSAEGMKKQFSLTSRKKKKCWQCKVQTLFLSKHFISFQRHFK